MPDFRSIKIVKNRDTVIVLILSADVHILHEIGPQIAGLLHSDIRISEEALRHALHLFGKCNYIFFLPCFDPLFCFSCLPFAHVIHSAGLTTSATCIHRTPRASQVIGLSHDAQECEGVRQYLARSVLLLFRCLNLWLVAEDWNSYIIAPNRPSRLCALGLCVVI